MQEKIATAETPAVESPTPPPPGRRSGSCLLRGLMVLGVVVIALGVFIWWYNRPIEPVELTAPEVRVVERKLAAIQPAKAAPASGEDTPPDAADYQPGTRDIVLTDREINGMLHRNTDLGDQIALEFAPGAIHARIETLLPEDLPVAGGRKFRARAKFTVDGSGASPVITLDDLTVWGISVPNDWIGGLKGKNLLGELIGSAEGNAVPGVESLIIENGRLVIRLKE